MRTVFTNDMLAHVWASQSQDHGRSNSMSFAGEVLYSYGTPIARIVKSRRGRVLLLTSESYSVTTQHHKFRAWRAFEGETFTVASLGVSGGRHREAGDKPDHRANLAELVARYAAECLRLRRARSLYQSVAESLGYAARMPIGYAAAFGFKNRLDVAADVAAMEAFRAARDIRLNTPAAIAKREYARMVRDAREAERTRLARLTADERIAEWRNGAAVYLGWGDGSAALRVCPGKPEVLETSRGATVPMLDAEALFGFVRRTREAGLTYDRKEAARANGAPLRVGHFTVDTIDAAGNVHAGCHYLAWSEIDRFATAQGWRITEAA